MIGYLFAPVERQDFARLGAQWGVMGRALAGAYHARALLDDSEVDQVLGITQVLRGAGRGLVRKWGPSLSTGWHDGDGEGLYGHLGGLWQAFWNGRRENVPDFVTVAIGWALIGAVWAAVGSLLIQGSIGAAHAAAAAVGQDLARQMLGGLFPFLGGGSVLAQGLGDIAKVMSLAAATLGGVGALWSAGVIAIDYTVTPDAAKQRYSPWVFVLRVAFAIGLLTPLSGGWSGGQQVVAALGVWGSAKASEAWTAMAARLSDTKGWVVRPVVPETDVLQAIMTTAAAEACRAAVNLDPARRDGEMVSDETTPNSIRYDYFVKDLLTGEWRRDAVGGCGTVEFPAVDGAAGNAVDGVMAAHRQAYSTLQKSLRTQVEAFVVNRVACRDVPANCRPDASSASLGVLPDTYRAALDGGIESAWQAANGAAAKQLASGAAAEGWIGAGKWSLSLSKLSGSIAAAGTAMPRVSPPQLRDLAGPIDAVRAWVGDGLVASGHPLIQAQLAVAGGQQGAADDLAKAIGSKIWSSLVEIDQTNALAGLSTRGTVVYSTGLTLLAATRAVDALTSGGGSAGPGGGLLMDMLDRARSGIAGAVTTAAKRFPFAAMLIGGISGAVKPIITGASLALIVVGLALAYLVPALPFIRFYFSVLGWLIAFFEAVMLVPVALVLMITAETGGFFGPAAKAGLWNVVGLVLRPILSLAGFVIGLMLITASIGLLNATMLPVVRDVMGGGFLLVSFVAYWVVYLALAYVSVNACTKVAESLPAAAYRWIGANAGGERDDGTAVGAAIGGAASRVMTEIGMRARAAGRAAK